MLMKAPPKYLQLVPLGLTENYLFVLLDHIFTVTTLQVDLASRLLFHKLDLFAIASTNIAS